MAKDITQVNGDAILAFGKQAAAWAEDLRLLKPKMIGLRGRSGLFEHATWFDGELAKFIGAVDTNITNLRGALQAISDDLPAIVEQYKRTEDLNDLEADKLTKLVSDVNKFLPVGSPIPAAAPAAGTTPPAAPPPVV
jgi:hypothetical protein